MTGLVPDGGHVGQVLKKITQNYAGQPEIDYEWNDILIRIAGNDPSELGVVYIVPGNPTNPQGAGNISINPDGGILVIPTTPNQYGVILDAPYDSKVYSRINGEWQEGSSLIFDTGLTENSGVVHVTPAGDSQDELGGVWVPDRQGISLLENGQLTLTPATDTQLGGFIDSPYDGKTYSRKDRTWVEATDDLTFGIGLTRTDNNVDLNVANNNGEIGGVKIVGRGVNQGLEYDIATGTLWAPLATDVAAGSIVEPPSDGFRYVRTRDVATETSTWVRETNTRIAGDTINEVGVVWVPDGSIGPGLDGSSLSLMPDGRLSAIPTTPSQFGVILDAPYAVDANDTRSYSRQNGTWIEAVNGIELGIGLDWENSDPKTNTIDLQKATIAGEIGGVRGLARSNRNGLLLDGNGYITVPLANHIQAGSIVEPPNDGKTYMRMTGPGNTPGGEIVSVWVAPASNAANFVWQTDWTPTGAEPISPTVPQFTFTVPAVELPPVAFDWVAEGLGVGHFFVHNSGRGPQTVTGNGGTWTFAVEYPNGSGTFIDVGNFSFGTNTFPDASNRVVRANPGPGANTVFRFDPATDPGITFAIRLTGGTPIGNAWDVITGIEGKIIGAPSTTGVGLPEAPVDTQVYGRKDAGWTPITFNAIIGDVKSSFLVVDHSGWIILDGRLVSTLTPTQQNAAQGLGFNTNLPDATNRVMMQNGAPGVTSGNWKITPPMLPVHNLALTGVTLTASDPSAVTSSGHDAGAVTSSGHDAGAVTSSSAGGHGHKSEGHTGDAGIPFEHQDMAWNKWATSAAIGNQGAAYTAVKNLVEDVGPHTHTVDMPNHTHTVDMPNHTHTVDMPSHNHTVGGTLPLGGSAADLVPNQLSVNQFVFLGA